MGTGVHPRLKRELEPVVRLSKFASQRVTRLGGVLARRRPPTASPSSRRMPEPNTGDRNSPGSRVEEFRTAKFRRGSPDGGVIFSFAVTHKSGVPITKGNSEDGARVSRTNTRRLSSVGLCTTGRTNIACCSRRTEGHCYSRKSRIDRQDFR